MTVGQWLSTSQHQAAVIGQSQLDTLFVARHVPGSAPLSVLIMGDALCTPTPLLAAGLVANHQ
jgi:hypothetical protein